MRNKLCLIIKRNTTEHSSASYQSNNMFFNQCSTGRQVVPATSRSYHQSSQKARKSRVVKFLLYFTSRWLAACSCLCSNTCFHFQKFLFCFCGDYIHTIYLGTKPEPALQIGSTDIKPFAIVFQGPLVHFLPIEITKSVSLLPSRKNAYFANQSKPLSPFYITDSIFLFKSIDWGLVVSGSLLDKDIF